MKQKKNDLKITLLRLDRKNPKSSTFGGGGVAMYLRNSIPFLALPIPSDKEGESKPTQHIVCYWYSLYPTKDENHRSSGRLLGIC